ncbi:hypothetical protein ACFFGH_00870 [Lysobacter korlensis]|uniref:Uncharacterized protein n=1 Tax=Lysobacter korlensis TaxID=553636 RepID=A0ABV6RHD4_9GAMM
MPTMWLIRDGRTSYAEAGQGMPLSFAEAVDLFASEDLRFVGRRAPSINPDAPSDSIENVLLQVEEGEGTNALLPQAGFYWAVSISPEDAEKRLLRERRKRQ